MDRRPEPWHPSEDEVARIREELRPLLCRMARREAVRLAVCQRLQQRSSDLVATAQIRPSS